MPDTDFQNRLNLEIQSLSDVNSVFSGILTVSSTFTPEDLRAYTAARLDAFVRTQINDGAVSRVEAADVMDAMIDENALSEADGARLQQARDDRENEIRRAKLTRAVFATYQAGQAVAAVHEKLREKVENNDTFVSLGNDRYTTKQVLQEEHALLQAASEMKGRQGSREAAEHGYAAALEKGRGAFLQFAASDDDFKRASDNTQTILAFSDLGILNGPPGTGKSTICQSVVFSMLSDDTQTLLPAGAKIYATSSNPKAADSIAQDLLDGVLVQDAPKYPDALPKNASEDEIATHDIVMQQYVDTVARRDRAMYSVAKQMGKKYAAAIHMHYTEENISSMLGDLESILAQMEDPDERRNLIKRIHKLEENYKALKNKKEKGTVAGEKGVVAADNDASVADNDASVADNDAEAEKDNADRELFNAYIQENYNRTIGLEKQSRIAPRSFEETVAEMNAGKVPEGSYVIVDEAGLMGRENMFKLMTAAAKTKTKLLLVGDNLQIPPQEAGHPFDLIVREAAVVKNASGQTLYDAEGVPLEDTKCSLTTKKIMRQDSPVEAQAGIDIRNGIASKNPPRGIYAYADKTYNGTDKAMDFIESDAKTNDALVHDYINYVIQSYDKKPDKRPSVVAVTTTQAKADVLNTELRTEMKARGLILPPYLYHGDMEFGCGDEVMFTSLTFLGAKGQIKVNPGETAVCKTDGKNPNILTLEFKNRKVKIDMTDEDKVNALDNTCSSLALPLALAQGMSKDRAFLSLTKGDVLDGPNGLVAFTRHQKQMSAYISKQAYADVDALAKDIVKFPQDMNAMNFIAARNAGVSEERKATLATRFKIAKHKFEYKRLNGAEKQTSQAVLHKVLQQKAKTK